MSQKQRAIKKGRKVEKGIERTFKLSLDAAAAAAAAVFFVAKVFSLFFLERQCYFSSCRVTIGDYCSIQDDEEEEENVYNS